MVHVAREMKRKEDEHPAIGRWSDDQRQAHCCEDRARLRQGPIVHVLDASRSVNVVEKLISKDNREAFVTENVEVQKRLVASYQDRKQKLVPYAEALEKRFATDWANVQIDKPVFTGVRVLRDFPIADIRPYIDWSPFFMTWELKGKYPRIFDDKVVGAQAKELYDDANRLLDQIIADGSLKANSVYGFWPAASDGDDIILYTDESRSAELSRFHCLRQQWERKGQKDYRSLADYVAPIDSGREDYVGGFVVTAGVGSDELATKFKADLDDYHAIMVQAIADRLAEAFAELMHERARGDWGFGKSEGLTKEEMIAEKYRGIRPAAGYPACPDHTEKQTLFDLLQAEKNAGVELTSSFAMTPGASVSGLYFGHPEARYFAVDRVTKDQIESYAKRKDKPISEIERWLGPNLAYEPS